MNLKLKSNCNIINVFTVSFDKFHAFLVNRSIILNYSKSYCPNVCVYCIL